MLRRFTPRNDSAFTLAEVLITLVIIGVVAALTIPNLMQKYTEQATVKQVQKFYSNLSNAYSLAVKENGNIDDWGITGSNALSTTKIYELLFKPYFKIAINCETTNHEKCISSSYINFNATLTRSYRGTGYYKLLLDDGSSIIIVASSTPNINLTYDINGKKGPNQLGVDMFMFSIHGKKLAPFGFPKDSNSFSFNNSCQKDSTDNNNSGIGCAAWVIYKGNMDYLHCDLTWDKHSCKD